MLRQLSIFLVTFAVGVVLAVVIRTAMHRSTVTTAAPVSAPTALTSASTPTPAPVSKPTGTSVNTICAICGMPVKPSLGTAEYHGKLIGFGCSACPAKFAANPDAYGPAALENKVVSE
ncbi:MAG: hypothetical protein AAB263_07005 [Planctomycetota bacterium]